MLTIGIKMFICLLSIGIKKELVIKFIYISFILVSKFWLVSSKFVFNASFIFNWHFLKFLLMCSLSIGIMMHYIDIFFNWYHVGFVLISPLEVFFLFRTKRGRICFISFLWPLCWWLTKRGRSIWVYMHVLCYACFYIGIKRVCFMFCWYWYQEWWILVSRNIVCFFIGTKSII